MANSQTRYSIWHIRSHPHLHLILQSHRIRVRLSTSIGTLQYLGYLNYIIQVFIRQVFFLVCVCVGGEGIVKSKPYMQGQNKILYIILFRVGIAPVIINAAYTKLLKTQV